MSDKTTLQELLDSHPLAVKAIDHERESDTWRCVHVSEWTTGQAIRNYAEDNDIGSAFDSIATLLDAIEAKLQAEAPLSDEEIEGMLWEVESDKALVDHWLPPRVEFLAAFIRCVRELETTHNQTIDRLHAEIKRLRKEATDAR